MRDTTMDMLMSKADVCTGGKITAQQRFVNLCRQKGTRCNAIMTEIEEGRDLKNIACRYSTGVDTLLVYRDALYGQLKDGVVDREMGSEIASLKKKRKPYRTGKKV